MKKAKERLEFRLGMFGLILPFIAVFVGILILAVSGKCMPMAFWAPCLAGILIAEIMAKKPSKCAEAFVRGMANEMVAVMLLAWFLAGIIAQLMKTTGLIEGLIWLSIHIGLKGRFFPVIVFILGSMLSTATGTALGTVMALAPIMYPVGVALGANPAVLAASIVSAAYFGDNIAPVSDTTIASAYSQGTEVSKVVASRLKYAFTAAAAAAILFFIFGGSGTADNNVDLSFVGELAPRGLIMLVVPAILIVMMYKGTHLVVALVYAGAIGIVIALLAGLTTPAALLFIDMDAFSVSGVLIDGINGMIDIAVFAMLLMGLINILTEGGFFDVLIERMHKYTKNETASEMVVAVIDVVLCFLTVANSVVIVMEGPIAKKLLVEKYHISRDRSANILDAVSCFAMCICPYGFAPLLTYSYAVNSGANVPFTINSICLFSFHGWFLGIVMFVSIITGWGRTHLTPQEVKELETEND